jgi:hypothetical protein
MIQAQSLEGRKFYVHAWGMSMTSRNSYEPELMQVVEDKGDTCVVAEVKNGKPSESWTKEWSREVTERNIKGYPAYRHINGYELTL